MSSHTAPVVSANLFGSVVGHCAACECPDEHTYSSSLGPPDDRGKSVEDVGQARLAILTSASRPLNGTMRLTLTVHRTGTVTCGPSGKGFVSG